MEADITSQAVGLASSADFSLINFFELLEDNDDVQNVYSNAKFVN